MQPEVLVRMANQIGKAFEPQGEARALPQIADHIDKFWDPRMKAAMAAHLAAGGAGLDPMVLKAMLLVKAKAQPNQRLTTND